VLNILIDIHCHANLYLALEQVIKEAKSVGVEKIIAVGMSAVSIERVLEISERHEEVYPALGIHPEEVKMNKDIENQLNSVIKKIRENKERICAIGEIGLDHHFVKEKELYPLQRNIFEKMLSLAQELELPVNLHTKGAEIKYSGKDGTPAMIRDVLNAISKFKDIPTDDLENQIYENTKKTFPQIF